MSRNPGDTCPRLVRMLMAHLRGEVGGVRAPASSERAMTGKQQREGRKGGGGGGTCGGKCVIINAVPML